MNTDIPIRTYSMTHPEAGYIEFSIPVMSPIDVEAYLQKKTKEMEPGAAFILRSNLLKIAVEMWNGFCLWTDIDADAARLELRKDDEVMRKCRQS